MCSYDEMVSNGMWPSKENTKLPLLQGWRLQWPALSGMGWATALAILSFTSCTIASAVHALIWVSMESLEWLPWRMTVTSVINGAEARVLVASFVGWCLVLEVVVALV
jgi:hypothetical protein